MLNDAEHAGASCLEMPRGSSDPWETGLPGREKEGQAPTGAFRGLTWESVRDILAAPAPCQRVILRLACHLVEQDGLQASVLATASKLKISEIAIHEAASRMPTLFRLGTGAHKVTLMAPGDDPSVLSPRAKEEMRKNAEKERRAAEKNAVLEARDSEDTPVNALRASLENLGMGRTEARAFARHLDATYGAKPALDATAEASKHRPREPKAYVVSMLKRSVGGHQGKAAVRVPSFTRSSSQRETLFIGWTTNLPREKVYRLPEGRLKIVKPRPDENVPSLAADAGVVIF